MEFEEMQERIKELNLKRFDEGLGTVTVTLVQGLYLVKVYGEDKDECEERGLYRTPERAYEELESIGKED